METKKTDPNWVLDGMWLCWFHKQLCCDTTRPPPGFPLWKKSVDFRLSTEYGPYERKTQFFQFMPTHSPKHLLSIGLYSKQGTFLFQVCKRPSWIRMYDMLTCWNVEKKRWEISKDAEGCGCLLNALWSNTFVCEIHISQWLSCPIITTEANVFTFGFGLAFNRIKLWWARQLARREAAFSIFFPSFSALELSTHHSNLISECTHQTRVTYFTSRLVSLLG